MIEGLSFPVYRRISTMILVPAQSHSLFDQDGDDRSSRFASGAATRRRQRMNDLRNVDWLYCGSAKLAAWATSPIVGSCLSLNVATFPSDHFSPSAAVTRSQGRSLKEQILATRPRSRLHWRPFSLLSPIHFLALFCKTRYPYRQAGHIRCRKQQSIWWMPFGGSKLN